MIKRRLETDKRKERLPFAERTVQHTTLRRIFTLTQKAVPTKARFHAVRYSPHCTHITGRMVLVGQSTSCIP